MRLGRHMPLGGKPVQALETAHEVGCDAIQIFVTNPRGWQPPTPNAEQAKAFVQAAKQQGIEPIVVHAAYLINLASPRQDVCTESVNLLRATLERARDHGGSSVVFHVGSHGKADEDAGIEQLIRGLKQVLEGSPEPVMLLLENDVGGGGQLGCRFENLARVLDSLDSYRESLGVCLDTAHLWSAGFDIGTAEGAREILAKADEAISLERVKVIHLNDTRKALGSHLDNHARIGEGIIPRAGLQAFLTHPSLAETTVLLETPIEEGEDGRPDWTAESKQIAGARELCGLRPVAGRE
ncbi:MAG: deoxyribonuclease IV [Ktedonobacterales bacterium]